MAELVDYDIAGPVARLEFRNGRSNRLTQALCKALQSHLDDALRDDAVEAILITSSGKSFCTGADSAWLDEEAPLEALGELCQAMDRAQKPIIAALHADALGAGAELALAAHFRVAAPGVKIALNDVLLGLPAVAGATQRLPRLTGADVALRLMISGKPVAASALPHVFDAEIAGTFEEGAMRFAQVLAEQGVGANPTSARRDGFADPFSYQAAVTEAQGHLGETDVVQAEILQCIEAAALLPFEAGLAREADAFQQCVKSRQSRALRYAHRLQSHAEEQTEAYATGCERVDHVALVGLGAQGRAIAVACLLANIRVTLLVLDTAQIVEVKSAVLSALAKVVEQKNLGNEAGPQASILLDVVDQFQECAAASIVLMTEHPSKVQTEKLFEILGQFVPGHVTLATTYPLVDVDLCGSAAGRDAQVLGLFFGQPFAGPQRVEIACTDRTADFTKAQAARFVQQLGKDAIASLYTPSGIFGTVQVAYWQALNHLLRHGASFSGVDAAMRAMGFAQGPFAILDQIGIPNARAQAKVVLDALQEQEPGVFFLDAMFDVDLYGQRGGKGFYLYEEGKDTHAPNPEAIKLVHGLRGERREAIAKDDIQKICIAAMANMGAGLVREGLVRQPSDIDSLVATRLGFSPRRGGPMQAADHFGLLKLRNLLSDLYKAHHAFEPDPLFEELIKNGKTFASLNAWK